MTTRSRTPDPEARFSGSDVRRMAGITPRQLQWWSEQGLLGPAPRENRRRYTADEALAALLIGALRRKGFSLPKIRRALRQFRREAERLGTDFSTGGAEWFLITDGTSVRLESSREAVVRLFKASRRAMALVAVGELAARIRECGKGAAEAAVTPGPERKRDAASRSSRPRKSR